MKTKILSGALLALSATILNGCSIEVPDCDSIEIKDNLIRQIKRSLSDGDAVIEITDVEKISYDNGLKLRECKGNLKMNGLKNGEVVPFTYRIQFLDIENRVYNVLLYPIR